MRDTLGCLLSLYLLLSGCSSPNSGSSSTNAEKGSSSTSSIIDSVEKNLSSSSETQAAPSPSRQKTSPPPPPKREAWMDTLMDLTGIPAPNAATLLEEEPAPRNLNSVQILIAKQYKPTRPTQLTLRLYVGEAGTVRRFQVLEVSDPKLVPEYYARALMELRFTPATHNGRPISAWTTQTFHINPEP